MHKIKWFSNKRVIRAIGEPDAFRSWVKVQPCCVCGETHGISLIGSKQGYAALPVCQKHLETEYTFMVTTQVALLKSWMSKTLGKLHNVDSLGYVKPSDLYKWALSKNIEDTLPDGYAEA